MGDGFITTFDNVLHLFLSKIIRVVGFGTSAFQPYSPSFTSEIALILKILDQDCIVSNCLSITFAVQCIAWLEQVILCSDDDDVCFVIDTPPFKI